MLSNPHFYIQQQLKDFGFSIRFLRLQKGWTQEDLAKKLDIAVGTIKKIENGSAGTAYGTILAVSHLLKISPDPSAGKNQLLQLLDKPTITPFKPPIDQSKTSSPSSAEEHTIFSQENNKNSSNFSI